MTTGDGDGDHGDRTAPADPPPFPPAPRVEGPRRDVAAVPPQGGHVAKRCPLRVQYEWFPPESVTPGGPADVELLRAETGAAFDVDVLAELRAAHPDAITVDVDRPAALQVAETLLALGRGSGVVLGARLPVDVIGRRVGRADALLRGDRRPDGTWSYHPVIVRNHRTIDSRPPREAAAGAPVATLDRPWAADAVVDPERSARTHQGDLLHLAHLHRLLEATPHGVAHGGPARGAVIGPEREVVWHRLDVEVQQHRWDQRRAGTGTTLERYDLELGFRLDVLAAAAAGRPIVGPVAVGECQSCPWRSHCWPRIEEADSTSLLPGFGYRQWYNLARAGIATRAQVAALDLPTALVRDDLDGVVDLAALVAGAAARPPGDPVAAVLATVIGPEHDRAAAALAARGIATAGQLAALDPTVVALADQPVRRLAEAVQGARALATGRPQLRHGLDRLVVPSADIEVDIDMESALDGSAYLWGAWVDGRYHAVASWEPPSPVEEARVFAEFWAWLTDLRVSATASGRRVATYCWFKGAESGALRRGAAAAAAELGMVEAPAQVEDLLAASGFVDLYEVFTSQLVTGTGAGLKVVATQAGFRWRDVDPNGADSMAWHADAVGHADPTRRANARQRLLAYNEDDVRATAAVRAWLRTSLGAASAPVA